MDNAAFVETTLRIPGPWSQPGELMERLPDGIRLTSKALILPDGTQIEFAPLQPDNQFAHVFKSSCRSPASRAEMKVIERYKLNVGLIGPGGSLKAALTMMRAATVILQAGGAGVFIDNSVLAHGGKHWIEIAEDGGLDALSFAFVNIVRTPKEFRTMGMNVLGRPDITIRRSVAKASEVGLIDLIRFMCTEDPSVYGAHLESLGFRPAPNDGFQFRSGSPMHNPFGRLKLMGLEDMVERN